MDDGKPLPFAATVLDGSGAVVGSVGQASRIDVRLEKLKTTLSLNWEAEPGASCLIHLDLKAAQHLTQAVEAADAVCVRRPPQQSVEPWGVTSSELKRDERAFGSQERYLGVARDPDGQLLPKGAQIEVAVDGERSTQAIVAAGGRVILRATAESLTQLRGS